MKPTFLLGLDFETTGLDFEKDRITEVGAVLWDVSARAPVLIFNALVQDADAPEITEEITRLTGITQAMIDEFGVEDSRVYARLNDLMSKADAVVAHNGCGFDRPMLDAQMRRYGEPTATLVRQAVEDRFDREKLWIDTCQDVEYAAHITTRKLTHLAAEHGFLNPFSHRAVFDVLTMLKVLDGYDLGPVMESAAQPMMTCFAVVSFADKEKAKARGYRWKAETKQWKKHVKAHKLEAEKAEAGFEIRVEEFQP